MVLVTTTESSASTSSTSPRSVSTNASSVVTTTESSASTSSSSPGSTTTRTSTMTSALTTSKTQQTRMLQVKSGAGWSTKDTMMTLHLGTGLWLLILSGGAMYVGGALSLLWVRLGALQDQRARFAPPAPSVNV